MSLGFAWVITVRFRKMTDFFYLLEERTEDSEPTPIGGIHSRLGVAAPESFAGGVRASD